MSPAITLHAHVAPAMATRGSLCRLRQRRGASLVAQANNKADPSPLAPPAPKSASQSPAAPKNIVVTPVTSAKPPLLKPKAASTAAQQQAQKPQPTQPAASPAALAEAWTKAVAAQQSGETVEGKVLGVTEAGLVVTLRPLKGFMPFKQVAAARIKAAADAGGVATLVGQTIQAKITTADPGRKDLILSERRLATEEALRQVKVGDTVEGVVTSVEDFGAFVAVKGMAEVSGLVRRNELSWERVMNIDEVAQRGQEVQAQVLSVEPATGKLLLSIRALQADPLKTSIDDLPWASCPDEGCTATLEALALVERLQAAVGITGVTITREAQDSHRVATELEIYLVRTNAEGSFTAIARKGTTATELAVETTLSREQLKQLLQRVASQASE